VLDAAKSKLLMLADWTHVSSEILTLAAVLLLGLVGALVLSVVLRRIRRLSRHSQQRWDDVVVHALASPVRVLWWVFTAYLLLAVYPATSSVKQFVERAADTSLLLLLAWFLHRLIKGVEQELVRDKPTEGASTDKAAVHATAKLLRIAMWVITGLMVLQSLGVSVSGLLAFGGIGGIAVGFAAKDLLANFFGGVSIYLDRPFTIGDWIRSPDREIEGVVESIGWRITCIRTFERRPLYIPNAVFSQIAIENPSRMENRRIFETVGIRYEDSGHMESIVDQVREMLQNHEGIDQSRIIMANFTSFGPSSLDFFVYAYTRTVNWAEYHVLKQEIMLAILKIIEDHGAEVAFPTRTLHVEQIAPEDMR
jgi:MscS family membrane protein